MQPIVPDKATITFYMPSALESGSWQLYLLVGVNLIGWLYSVVILSKRFALRRYFYFKNFILFMAALALIYDCVLFFVGAYTDIRFIAMIYLSAILPRFFQFTTYTLLLLYLARGLILLHGKEYLLKRMLYPTYVLSMALFTSLSVVLSVATGRIMQFLMWYDFIGGLVVALIGIIGSLLYWRLRAMSLSAHKKKKFTITIVCISTYYFLNAVRVLYNILILINLNPIESAFKYYSRHNLEVFFSIFLGLNFLSRSLPALIVVVCVRVMTHFTPRQERISLIHAVNH